MSYKTIRPAKIIKDFLYPSDQHHGTKSLIIVLVALVSCFLSFRDLSHLPNWLKPYFFGGLGLLIIVSIFITIRVFFVSRRQIQVDDRFASNEAAVLYQTDDYHQLDYSALNVNQLGSRADPLTPIAVTLAIIGTFLLFASLAGWAMVLPEMRMFIIILIILLFAPLVWLLRKYGTRLFRSEKSLGYEQFAQQNHFVHTKEPDTVIRDTLKDLDMFRRYANNLEVDRRLFGEYRNHSFAISLAKVYSRAGTPDFVGVLSFSIANEFNTADRTQFEDQANVISYVDSIEYPPGYICCIIQAGIPSTRAAMIRLFQTFDAAIAIENNQ